MDRSNKHDNNAERGVTPRIRLCSVSSITRKKSPSLTQLASQTENTISPILSAGRISPSVPVNFPRRRRQFRFATALATVRPIRRHRAIGVTPWARSQSAFSPKTSPTTGGHRFRETRRCEAADVAADTARRSHPARVGSPRRAHR